MPNQLPLYQIIKGVLVTNLPVPGPAFVTFVSVVELQAGSGHPSKPLFVLDRSKLDSADVLG
jgi:hypothetical protein